MNINNTLITKVEIDITHICNCKCKSCNRLCDIPNANVDSTMTLNEIKQIADQLKRYDVKEIHVIGGEPCLNPEVYEICDHLCHEFQKSNVIIFSNGTCPQTIEKLKNIKNLKFNVKKENTVEFYKKWHINIFDERNIVHKDDYSDCFTLKWCGINIYKQNGKLLFARCIDSMFITRLLGTEDKYSKSSLDELMNDFPYNDFYKDVCSNCTCYSTKGLGVARKHKDLTITSEIFKNGLLKITQQCKT